MHLRSVTTFLVSLFLGAPTTSGPAQRPATHYSGVEWVLDAEGHLLGSTALVLEHGLDIGHRGLQLHVVRESPDARGLFPRESVDNLSMLSTRMAPSYMAEARLRRDDGPDMEITEELKGDVLIARKTIRDASGRIAFIHIINATPLTPCEHAARVEALRSSP